MKNQTSYKYRVLLPGELKVNGKNQGGAKKPIYIYTEEDLGEGLLDMGVTS